MTYLDRLKKILEGPSGEVAKVTKKGFGAFVTRSPGPFQKTSERPTWSEALEALVAIEPNSPAEVAFTDELEAQGWTRGELVALLNEATVACSLKEVHAIIATWGEDRRLDWEERAAIREYDGGFPRGEAEILAFYDLVTPRTGDRAPSR